MGILAPLAPILGLVGAGVSAVGTVESGIATKNAAEYQAQVAENNALIANQNAERAQEAGWSQTEQKEIANANQIGAIKASQGANNIDVNSGSALDVQSGQREENQLSAENVLQNAELTSYGYRTQAQSDTSQAALEEQEASEAIPGAALAAGGGILANASTVGFKYGGGAGSSSGGGFSLPGDLSGTNWSGVG